MLPTFNVIVPEVSEKRTTYLILGPKNNYVEVTTSTFDDIKNKGYKGNLNDFFIFQLDVKDAIRKQKDSLNNAAVFTNNIPDIWKKTPESIKANYKLLSKELEKSNQPSELVIRPFDPKKNLDRKRSQKKSKIRHRKSRRYKGLDENNSNNITRNVPMEDIENVTMKPISNVPAKNIENVTMKPISNVPAKNIENVTMKPTSDVPTKNIENVTTEPSNIPKKNIADEMARDSSGFNNVPNVVSSYVYDPISYEFDYGYYRYFSVSEQFYHSSINLDEEYAHSDN